MNDRQPASQAVSIIAQGTGGLYNRRGAGAVHVDGLGMGQCLEQVSLLSFAVILNLGYKL